MPVPGHPDYEVSDMGRVRSLDRMVRTRWTTKKSVKGRVLSLSKVGGSESGGRYYGCVLCKDGRRRPAMVHVLVLEAFVGPRPPGAHACHRDDNPANNTLANLYWGSPAENVRDAIASGRHRSVTHASKTHCPQGHPYTPDNVYIKPSRTTRECRTCHRHQSNASYRKRHPDALPGQSDRTHCPRGHAYNEENTYRAPSSPNKRVCRECLRIRRRQRSA